MIKTDEATNRTSCWNKARDDERVFVLLARDAAAPQTLRYWAQCRVELGKNQPDDPQIVEALDCADRMEDEARRINYRPHGGGMSGHDEPGPKFSIGDRVRLNYGTQAEFVVAQVRANHGGVGAHRYWGDDQFGNSYGAYEAQLEYKKE